MKIKSYKYALNYLENFIGKIVFKIDPRKNYDPLERMRVLLGLLGNPEQKFKSVLVGGTSGKGSTAYLISHILTTAGYKTGFTVSPHLQRINERLQINGEQISDENFTDLLTSILSSIEGMKEMPIGAPSYFEILVGMAFTYFAKEKVDIAIVEVGMGGEFDATNTLNPLIAVLTNVGLDHTNILGTTVDKIAKTKAGIIKRMINDKGLINNSSLITNHLTVVSGVKQSSVIKIIEERCKNVGAKLRLLWRDFGYKIKKAIHEGSVFDLAIDSDRLQKLNDLQLSLIGDYQVENASIAIKTVLELEKFGFKVSDKAIRKALKTAFFPGRFEILSCHPEFISGSPANRQASLESSKMLKQVQHDNGTTIVLDGAHNPVKMKEFLKSLRKIFPTHKKIFIVGFKFDKDIKKMLRQITKVADEIIVTQFKAKTDTNIHASADAFKIKNQISSLRQGFGRQAKIKNNMKVIVEKDSKKALKIGLKTIQQFNNPAILVVTGSLYLVGEVRNLLK